MTTSADDQQDTAVDQEDDARADTATERALAEIERRSRAMVEGMRHFGGA